MEDDSFPQQEPALFLQGLRHRPPEDKEEKLVFQQLLEKKMLFRDPGTGPDRHKLPHLRFRAGEPIRSSEGADRRRSRSPERQETARKRHRNLKD